MMFQAKMPSLFLFVLIASAAPAQVTGNVSSATHNDAGVEYLKTGNYSKAEFQFREAIRIDAGVKYYYNNLGVSLMNQRRHAEAAVYLRTAVSMDSAYTKAVANLAISEFYLLNFRESYRCYLMAMRLDRNYAENRLNKRAALLKIKELSRTHPENNELKSIIRHLEEKE
jgi:Tfp pilus assembly protein PilF